jgi:hypothetical protein
LLEMGAQENKKMSTDEELKTKREGTGRVKN